MPGSWPSRGIAMSKNDAIRSALAAEVAVRKRYWIGGVPTPGDQLGVIRIVAHRLKSTEEAVRAAMEESHDA